MLLSSSAYPAGVGIVVDVGLSGTELGTALKLAGFGLVHLRLKDKPALFDDSPRDPGFFIADETATADLRGLASALQTKYSPRFIIPGSELGVYLAAQLASLLQLPSNPPQVISRFRDKLLMAATALKNGLLAPRTFEVRSTSDAIHAQKMLGTWPVVVKPIDSLAGDGLNYAYDSATLISSVQQILEKPTTTRRFNTNLILQEYICGRQCFVNAVSQGGLHHITDVWIRDRYTSPGCLLWKVVLLRPENTAAKQAVHFTNSLLNAFELTDGPTHTEIFLTRNGPVLIESAARHRGRTTSEPALKQILHRTQIDVTVSCLKDRQYIIDTMLKHQEPNLFALIIPLYPSSSGLFRGWRRLDDLKRLTSLVDIYLHAEIDAPVIRHQAQKYCLGYITLASDRQCQIGHDYKQIRELLRRGLFEIDKID